jgi:hypothetical protein
MVVGELRGVNLGRQEELVRCVQQVPEVTSEAFLVATSSLFLRLTRS